MFRKNKVPNYLKYLDVRIDKELSTETSPQQRRDNLNEIKIEICEADKKHRTKLKRAWMASSIVGLALALTSISYLSSQKLKNKDDFYTTNTGIAYSTIASTISNLYDIREELNKSSQKYTQSLQKLNTTSQPEEIKKENRELSSLISSKTQEISENLTNKISEYEHKLEPLESTHEYLQFKKKNNRIKIAFPTVFASGLILYILGAVKANKYDTKETSNEANALITKANAKSSSYN